MSRRRRLLQPEKQGEQERQQDLGWWGHKFEHRGSLKVSKTQINIG